jgi:exosortase/archaeosortase family protein
LANSKRPTVRESNAPLLRRISAFIAVFIIVSGLLGPRIISNGLLYRYHFDIYGPAGKAFLFSIVAFGILTFRKWHIVIGPWRLSDLVWALLACLSFICASIAVSMLENGTAGAIWPSIAHISLLATIIFGALTTLGYKNIRQAIRTFRHEIYSVVALSILFIGFLDIVYSFWKYLSATVLHAVHFLLAATGVSSTILPPRTLLFDKFGVEIAQYCSGVESIALFTALYALVGLLDWSKLNHKRFLILFVPGLLVLFACNILRVYLLILAGYFINPHIAFSLFHTYAGMLFFILYSALFWRVSYRWLMSTPHILEEQAKIKQRKTN